MRPTSWYNCESECRLIRKVTRTEEQEFACVLEESDNRNGLRDHGVRYDKEFHTAWNA